jgi:hypothetical protein
MASSLVTLHLPRLYRDRDYVHEVYVLGQSLEIVARLTCNICRRSTVGKPPAPFCIQETHYRTARTSKLAQSISRRRSWPSPIAAGVVDPGRAVRRGRAVAKVPGDGLRQDDLSRRQAVRALGEWGDQHQPSTRGRDPPAATVQAVQRAARAGLSLRRAP